MKLLALRVAAAGAGGTCCWLAFAPRQWWLLLPLGLAGLQLGIWRAPLRVAALMGLIWGLAFFIPLLSWSGIYVGAWPWLLLATSQAAFTMPYALLLAWASSSVKTRVTSVAWVGLAIGGWVMVEQVRSTWPWGGLAWGRFAFASAEVSWLPLVGWVGTVGLSAFVACLGALLTTVCMAWNWRLRLEAVAVLVMALLAPLVMGVGSNPSPPLHRAVIAVVQGNVPRMGLDFNAQQQAVLNDHVQATMELAAAIQRGQHPRPDVVIWPENSSDIDPFRHRQAFEAISRAADAVGVPLVVGTVLVDGAYRRNASLVWWPASSGQPGPDPTQRYIKRHPVPFAEYIPLRSLARRVSDKVDLVEADFAPGDTVGLLRLPTVTGEPLPLGVLICFEISVDSLVRDVGAAGAGPVAVQTNNATFGFSSQSSQQVVIAQVQAAHLQRPVLVASTSGISAVINREGVIKQRSDLFTSAVLVATVEWSNDRPPARWGQPLILVGTPLVALLALVVIARSRKAPRDPAL